jgi:alkylation response protein AidB-like acyl-CoA dehydrogenase
VRDFADEDLIPHEVEAEMNGGDLADDIVTKHRKRALKMGLSAMDVPRDWGGLELNVVTQAAIWEELGRVTNALSWCFSEPQAWMFEACTEEQVERYLLPLMRGERHTAYAITEAGPGSDASGIKATAERTSDGYRINGEKWYVTDGNHADFFILQAGIVEDGREAEQALFFVEKESPGIELVRTPAFSHSFASHHPIYQFTDVVVPAENRIGKAGDGLKYTYSWFRRERLMIAARCCGAASRLIEEATAFAEERMIEDRPLADRDWVQFALADSTTELWAARLMTYDAAQAYDNWEDPKVLHSRCAMAKLFASEMANRVADRAVQIFGGRGYMRENVAERFYRELRVDRIWEGTSEIQRLIIARRFRRDGFEGL